MSTLTKTKKDLGNLLRYTEELSSMNEKVVYDLGREKYPHFWEHLTAGLEGVEIGVDAETWIRICRLRETLPPAPDVLFNGWVDFGNHPSPKIPPALPENRMLQLLIEDISELAEAGLLPNFDDVMRPVGADTVRPELMDVILRTANMPDFRRLWREYLDGPWAAWAEMERPRRRSIDFYNKIYQIYQRIMSMGDDTPIELVFGVGIVCWKVRDERLNIPLIEQLVEIELEEEGTLLIRPRHAQPQLALRAFHELEIEGSKNVQRDIGQQFERFLDDPDRGFSPFDKSTFESILRSCSARLSASGIYHPDILADPNDRTVPDCDEFLRITDTWVIYVRQRNEDFRKEDIRRLIRQVELIEDESQLPLPAAQFVKEPSSAPSMTYDGSVINLTETDLTLPENTSGWKGGMGGGSASARTECRVAEETNPKTTYFFPLPFNEDQQEIIRRLQDETTEGVVVQGPPGTGKTHTIANIICHYLATKRRVLVTAKTPEALTALQEKIPEGIRDLAIAVIHNDREGARQLEQAVRILADEAKSINPKLVDGQIRERQARIAELREAVSNIDEQLYAFAERNLARVEYGKEKVLPMSLAKAVADERHLHLWFDDKINLTVQYEPQFTNEDIIQIRELRRNHSGDLVYQTESLPDPALLPELPQILAAHGELVRLHEIEGRSNSGEIPFMSLKGRVGLEEAKKASEWLGQFTEMLGEMEADRWLFDIYQLLIGLKRIDEAAMATLRSALSEWLNLYVRGRDFSLKAIIIDGVETDPALDKAIGDLAAGRKPFGVFSLFKGGLKAKIDAVRVQGRLPSDPADWGMIRDYRLWQQQVILFLGRWNGLARAIGAQHLPSEWLAVETELLRLGGLINRIWAIHEHIAAWHETFSALFPYGLDIDEALLNGRCQRLAEALAANLEKAELVNAHALKAQVLSVAGDGPLPFYAALREVCTSLGQPTVTQTVLAEAWRGVLSEAVRLKSIADDFAQLDRLVSKVASSGAPNWAYRLRNEAPVGSADIWTPDTWRTSWDWARADGHLTSLGNRETVRELSEARAQADAEQKRLFAEVVRLRTFLGLKLSLTNKVEAALAKFAAAIARLGKGTGKTAGRQRRIIREAAMDTAQAVPCWILPEWRVAEQLPPDLAAFDLVIIDESSQSDISSLPA
ncbi:MAG: AAA domain-containing protein, partial [Verrucomicrobiota bacterium]